MLSERDQMSKKSRNFLGILLLSVFLGQFFGSSLFPHTHTMSGVVVVHSHPYNFFDKHKHQHSEEEIVILHCISHAVFTAPLALTPIAPDVQELVLLVVKKLALVPITPIYHFSLRAPPFVDFK